MNQKINWDLLKAVSFGPEVNPEWFAQQYSTAIMDDKIREYSAMVDRHQEAAGRGQDNPIVELAYTFSRRFYKDSVLRDYGTNTTPVIVDGVDPIELREIGSLEGRWRDMSAGSQFLEVLMRDAGLDTTWRSQEYRTSEMAQVISELLHKLFLGYPIRFATSTHSFLEKYRWTNRPYESKLNFVTIAAAGYMVVAYDDDKTRSVIGDARLFHYLRSSGFCMFFLKKESTQDKEMLMIATHRKMGRIFKYPIRDKEFSAMMVGKEWTESERMMAEMVGFKDQMWLDSKEIGHIMNIPTLKPEEIEKWREAYLF